MAIKFCVFLVDRETMFLCSSVKVQPLAGGAGSFCKGQFISDLVRMRNYLWILLAVFVPNSWAVPFVVQTLSSRYGLVLGGYGPGYKELREVEVVKHDKVCQGSIKDIPVESGRFLGDVSGMAEYVNGSVIFCRHSSCWRLDVAANKWGKVGQYLI